MYERARAEENVERSAERLHRAAVFAMDVARGYRRIDAEIGGTPISYCEAYPMDTKTDRRDMRERCRTAKAIIDACTLLLSLAREQRDRAAGRVA